MDETELVTWPATALLDAVRRNDDYKAPYIPFAVWNDTELTRHTNDVANMATLVKELSEFPASVSGYGCQGTRREIPLDYLVHSPLLWAYIKQMGWINDRYFNYTMDSVSVALLTYEEGQGYEQHVDISPGLHRKLSGTLQLTSSYDYAGGDLVLEATGKILPPRAQGGFIVFPAWLRHYVTPVKQGTRHSLVFQGWGPAFQ